MPRRPIAFAITLAASLAMASTAQAYLKAEGPVRRPHVSHQAHVAFELSGSGWKQLAGASGGTPELGDFQRGPRAGCTLQAGASATLSSRPARVHGHRVVLKPGSPNQQPFTYTRHGHNGTVTWWTGSAAKGTATALGGAEQRAPANLATKKDHWLIYRFSARPLPGETTTCTDREATSIVRTIGRHLRLAHGAVHTHGPYATL